MNDDKNHRIWCLKKWLNHKPKEDCSYELFVHGTINPDHLYITMKDEVIGEKQSHNFLGITLNTF